MKDRLKGLYVITDNRLVSRGEFLGRVEAALDGGANVLQLREKGTPYDEAASIGREVARLTASRGVPLIVNDIPMLAKEIGAQGVHLGEGDPSIEVAREVLGEDAIIGVSCYGSIERGIYAEEKGADYVAFGTPYPTPTKPGRKPTPFSVLVEAKRVLRIPVFAIGGITAQNAREVLATGVDGIAVITSVFGASDPKRAAEELSAIVREFMRL
jgi:thiamine-phosphate pyrophosphorylase